MSAGRFVSDVRFGYDLWPFVRMLPSYSETMQCFTFVAEKERYVKQEQHISYYNQLIDRHMRRIEYYMNLYILRIRNMISLEIYPSVQINLLQPSECQI